MLIVGSSRMCDPEGYSYNAEGGLSRRSTTISCALPQFAETCGSRAPGTAELAASQYSQQVPDPLAQMASFA